MKITLFLLIIAFCSQLKAEEFDFSRGIALDEFFRISAKEKAGDKITDSENEKYVSGIWYIRGFMDGCSTLPLRDEVPFVLPKELTVRQIMLILEKFVKEHPEYLHHDTCVLMFLAIGEAFPKHPKTPKPN